MKITIIKTIFIIVVVSAMAFAQENHKWEPTNGPFGGNITALVVDPKDNIFAGTLYGGIYESCDYGRHWSNILNVSSFINALVIDAAGTLYAAVHDSGLYLLKKNTSKWTKVNTTNGDVVAITLNSKNEIFLGTYVDGLLKSTDSCQTWQEIRPVFSGYLSSLVVDSNDNLFAATSDVNGGNGISFSSDNGMTWNDISTDSTGDEVACLAISKSGVLWASVNRWPEEGDIFTSNDKGKHWSKLTTPFNTKLVGCITFDYQNNIYIGTAQTGIDNGLYLSKDAGNSWTEITTILDHSSIASIVCIQPNLLLIGTDNGIQVSNDSGITWKYMNDGISALHISSLAVGIHGEIYAGTEHGKVFFSTNNGDTWKSTSVVEPAGTIHSLYVNNMGDIIASTDQDRAYGGSVYRSTNQGITWKKTELSQVYALPLINLDSSHILTYFYNDQHRTGIFSESVDNGDHWQSFPTEMDGFYVSNIFRESGGTIYASTSYNYSKNYGAVFESIDNAKHWDSIKTFPSNVTTVTAKEALIIISADYKGLSISKDGGKLFKMVQLAHNTIAYTLLIDKNGKIYAGCNSGIYESSDSGDRWIKTFDRMVKTLITSSNNYLFAGTMAGVYRKEQ
jgi:ligand-binding sensor domain-containing protein